MAVPVIMPRQGQSVETCIISEIRKKKGERISIGDILFTYETDKAAFDEEAKTEGIVLEVFFAEGDEVPVFANVMVIGLEGESVEEFRHGGAEGGDMAGSNDKVKGAELPETKKVDPGLGSGKVVKGDQPSGTSPRARALAERKGVDVSQLSGSGPQNRIIERDIQQAAASSRLTPLAKRMRETDPSLTAGEGTGLAGAVRAADLMPGAAGANGLLHGAAPEVTDYEIRPLTNIRKLIAKAMHESLLNSAQLTHHLGADARRINQLRKKVKMAVGAGRSEDITIGDMICFATIKALKKFPNANAHFLGDSIRYFSKVHLAVAVDTDRGLMVPVIRNAGDLTIAELSSGIKEVAAACRKGSISPELLSGEAASFTVSNLGNYGVEMFTPVINMPQVAILGVNTMVLRPKELEDGTIGFVPYLGLSLTYDHRAIDGGEATRFVKQIATEIENLEFEIQ